MSLSVGVIAFMFVFAYLPQLAVLVFVNGPLAAFTTILLTLSESSTLINILSRTFLLQDALVDTFDGVLVARRQTGILAEGRQLKSGNFNDPIAKLGKLVKSPFEKFSPTALVRYVMYLPFNFIPVVGTVIFVLLQGRARGSSVHTRVSYLHLSLNSSTNTPVVFPAEEVDKCGERRMAEREYSPLHCVCCLLFFISVSRYLQNSKKNSGATPLALVGGWPEFRTTEFICGCSFNRSR